MFNLSSEWRLLRLAKLLFNFFFGESPSVSLQQRDSLFHGQRDLVADGYHALGEVQIVFLQQLHCDHDVVDVVEHQSALLGVRVLLLQKCGGVLAPVAQRVEVVRCVIAVVVTVTIALRVTG